MKEIKEEIKREVIDTHIHYEATDGTVFQSAQECKEYEKSAKGVIRTKASKLIVGKEHDAWSLMGGYDDHTVVAFKPQAEKDVDTLMHLMLFENPYLNDDGRKELCEERHDIIYTAYKNNDVVLFGLNCDNEYYFINSRQGIIGNLMALDRKEEKDA